jgi:hypothetical protein
MFLIFILSRELTPLSSRNMREDAEGFFLGMGILKIPCLSLSINTRLITDDIWRIWSMLIGIVLDYTRDPCSILGQFLLLFCRETIPV